MERVAFKSYVPILIAEKAVKSNECGSTSLVTPSVFPILQVNFFELARINRPSEAPHKPEVKVSIVFIHSLVDQIKIAKNQPFCPICRFLVAHVVKE